MELKNPHAHERWTPPAVARCWPPLPPRHCGVGGMNGANGMMDGFFGRIPVINTRPPYTVLLPSAPRLGSVWSVCHRDRRRDLSMYVPWCPQQTDLVPLIRLMNPSHVTLSGCCEGKHMQILAISVSQQKHLASPNHFADLSSANPQIPVIKPSSSMIWFILRLRQLFI